MFQITPHTCRAFTFAEVLIMAAMNVESVRVSLNGRNGADSLGTPDKYARHVVRPRTPQAPQL
ncbi:MAG TPA: hypothetical protein VMS18_26880 [Candidatus Binatia bacterium]|nr:hypothetical protein [Candidatus Sulfotelmatobacter sp.]HXJ90467.1 hypothetical protein [Candidatus Binatia bacterium]